MRHPELRKLYDEAQHLTAQIEHDEIRHALREHNQDADRLANEAMDRGKNSPRGEAAPHLKSEFTKNTSPEDRAADPGTDRSPIPRVAASNQEFEGIVRNGVIELQGASLPEGTRVQVRRR